MRMGNYLRVWLERLGVMAATGSSFGMGHPTVVPTNFEPPAERADEERADDPTAIGSSADDE